MIHNSLLSTREEVKEAITALNTMLIDMEELEKASKELEDLENGRFN